MKQKLIVMGYAGHGKDTVCELLKQYGYTFASSSEFAGKVAVYPILKEKYGYNSFEECFADRVNHRAEWFELIAAYNAEDKARLGLEIFAENDIYCGLRNEEELIAIVNYFHSIEEDRRKRPVLVWVDATKRLNTVESTDSNTIDPNRVNVVIDNNDTLEDLKYRVEIFAQCLSLVSSDRHVFDCIRPKSNVIQFGDRGTRDGY